MIKAHFVFKYYIFGQDIGLLLKIDPKLGRFYRKGGCSRKGLIANRFETDDFMQQLLKWTFLDH